MEDTVLMQSPIATPVQVSPILPPEAAQLGEVSVAAMRRAIETTGLAIAAGLGRRADASDLDDLTRAALSGWEVAILDLIADEARPQPLRSLAVQILLAGRPVVEGQASALARLYLGPPQLRAVPRDGPG